MYYFPLNSHFTERSAWSFPFLMIGTATGNKGTNVREVSAEQFVTELSKYFEVNNLCAAPKWADLVKTGCLKQMPPNNEKWWYIRAASIARQVYLHPGMSIKSLRNKYGGNKNYGVSPKHFCQAGGKIIRTILQQLEEIEYVKKDKNGGRIITPKGQKQLDLIAKAVKSQQ